VLHSGLVVAAAVAPFVPVVLVAPLVPDARLVELVPLIVLVALEPLSDVALLVVWAITGVAPMTAAAIRLRVKGIRFICFLLVHEKTTCVIWDRRGHRGLRPA